MRSFKRFVYSNKLFYGKDFTQLSQNTYSFRILANFFFQMMVKIKFFI